MSSAPAQTHLLASGKGIFRLSTPSFYLELEKSNYTEYNVLNQYLKLKQTIHVKIWLARKLQKGRGDNGHIVEICKSINDGLLGKFDPPSNAVPVAVPKGRSSQYSGSEREGEGVEKPLNCPHQRTLYSQPSSWSRKLRADGVRIKIWNIHLPQNCFNLPSNKTKKMEYLCYFTVKTIFSGFKVYHRS